MKIGLSSVVVAMLADSVGYLIDRDGRTVAGPVPVNVIADGDAGVVFSPAKPFGDIPPGHVVRFSVYSHLPSGISIRVWDDDNHWCAT